MTDYAIRHGFLAESGPDAVPAWSAHATGYLHEDHYPPCLVVTGDLDEARRRLVGSTFGAIERAAREAQARHVAWMREQGAHPNRATTWASLDDRTHDYWRQIVRAALVAAEETPDA